jgi:hypothetical protein
MRITLHKFFNRKISVSFLQSDRVRGWIFSFFFGNIAVASFYALEFIVPHESSFYSETVTVLFILISVFILFPARDMALRFILKRSDYDRIFGGELHHLDFIAQHFTIPSMTSEVFPALMIWLKVRSGRIAVMDNTARQITFYILRRNQVIQKNSGLYEYYDDLSQFMKYKRSFIYNYDEDLPASVRSFMDRFNVRMLIPFIYRKNPVGFLILHESPQHQFSQRALDLFARKAAVTIHNAQLSEKMADFATYDREMRSAVKVQKFLHKSPVPHLKSLKFSLTSSRYELTAIEFIPAADQTYTMIILAFPRISGIGGIVLAGIIGRLFSFIHFTSKSGSRNYIDESELLQFLKQDHDPAYTDHRAEFMICTFSDKNSGFRIMTEGNFSVNLGKTLVAVPGSRQSLNLTAGKTIDISYKKNLILNISRVKPGRN